jgi:ParB family chromosome partitioning protein
MSNFYNDAIFWVEVEKIEPNPYQPRREFDEARLRDLADSIRQYGVLQPLVVTRNEVEKPDGGLMVMYELIAGERRLRASKLAGIAQVPVLIRSTEDDAKTKLELAIIENLQREDLNAVDRAKAFARLVEEFGFKHAQIAQKIGKSREYVSNTVRVLTLPEEILQALSEGKISEGHTRPLMMLDTRKEEQITLFKEIVFKKMTVREAERIARRVAHDRARKVEEVTPEMLDIEDKLAETLGTRVQIERKTVGGKLIIDFFSERDLESILNLIKGNKKDPNEMLNRHIAAKETVKEPAPAPEEAPSDTNSAETLDDRSAEEKKADEESEDIYNVNNFSI